MKKCIALLQILLTISMSLAFSFTPVVAEQVCCEQTAQGDFCQYVDQAQCAQGSAYAATSCDQTSFCKPGCCYDQNGDGYCYGNYAKATCEKEFSGKYSDDPSCTNTLECKEGCCMIGTQAAFVTETRCKTETAKYPDLTMDFKTDITTEAACLEQARTTEKGACLKENTCTYTTRATCEGDFRANTYCSQLPEANCAPANPAFGGQGNPEDTGCLPNEDDVYWIDSCGNQEGIRQACDYTQGSLCGDSDKDGKFTCESLNCNENQYVSTKLEADKGQVTPNVEQGGILNGESWCLYDAYQENNPLGTRNSFDTIEYHARDLVGSRYYRSICIAGQELVEPCKDYRGEFCIADQATLPQSSQPFSQSGCVENRWESCISECNTADSIAQDPTLFAQNVENDQDCCADISTRDCAWVGKCVPKVSPGFKFWEDEGANTCEQANLGCPLVVRCPGWQRLFTGGKCGGDDGWQILDTTDDGVPEAECLSQDFMQAANNLCRSLGDCGATYNIQGKLSEDGISMTQSFGEEFDRTLRDDVDKFFVGQGGGYVTDIEGNQIPLTFSKGPELPGPFEEAPDWDKGTYFFSYTEPKDTKGKWRLLIGPSAGARRPKGPGGTEIVSFLTTTGSVAAVLYFGIAGNTGVYSNVPKGSGNFLKSTFFAPLFSALGDTEKLRDAEKEKKDAQEKKQSAFEKLEPLLPGIMDQLKGKTTTEQTEILKNTRPTVGNIPQKEAIDGAVEATDKVDQTTQAADAAKASVDQGKVASKSVQQVTNIVAWLYIIYKLVNVLNEKVQTITVESQCSPYVQPVTIEQDQCEKCNKDYQDYVDNNGKPTDIQALKICSEYRCKSLGATCELINKGTDNELCISLSPYEIAAPIITPWVEGFEEQYQNKIQATDQGLTITEELPIYNNVDLALETDQPAQCKMNFEHSKTYEDMPDYFFGSANYDYFHVQTVFFPRGNEEQGLTFNQGGGEYTIYIRCKSATGRVNENDYSIRLKISQEPDITAPIIETTSMGNDAFLTANATQTPVTLYVNEQATCGWATNNIHFDSMTSLCTTSGPPSPKGTFECHFGDNIADAGPAINGLTLNPGDIAYVYFKCKDLANNANKESFQLTMHGTKELQIESIEPEGPIFTSLNQQNTTLKVTTRDGANLNGKAMCKYTDVEANAQTISLMNTFINTNASIHTQPLILSAGQHNYFATCYDQAGNTAHAQTTFTIQADTYTPQIIRAFKDLTQTPMLFKIKTNEQATCEYTTDKVFNFGEGNPLIQEPGNIHTASGDSDTYYVVCEDEYGNRAEPILISFIY